MIEGSSQNEIEVLWDNICGKYGEDLDVNTQKLRNPRLYLLNIPEDITLDNFQKRITVQNPELDFKEGDRAKCCYTSKRERRKLVINVESGTTS